MSSVTGNVADPVSAFCSQVDEALETGKPEAVPDESLQRVLSAAVRLYAAKSEDRARELPPFGDKPVNATEAVTAICAIMRAADINFFDLQMWYRRAPNEQRLNKAIEDRQWGEAMNEIMVGELSEFAEGGYRVLRVDAFEFGVFRQGDRLTAYENYCPHDGGPVCQGKVIPRVEEELAADQTSRGLRFSASKNIVCPWHGWEFDIATGRHCGDPKYRLRPVDVKVRDNRVYVSVPAEA